MTSILLFIFGSIIGSFANVIVYRLHTKEKGIVAGRSKCRDCNHLLESLDLVPIFSYLFLQGKCRYCKSKVSKLYIFGEITMALLFAFVGYLLPINIYGDIFSQILVLIPYLLVIFVLVIVTFYDFLYLEIPDIVMLPAILGGLIASFIDPFGLLQAGVLSFGISVSLPLYAFYGGLIIFLFFAIQILISQGRWMGGGDLRLGAFMGVILGIKLGLVALFLSYIIGSIVSIGLLCLHKKGLKSAIPFGPFLSAGMLIALFFGEAIVAWYMLVFIV